MSSGISSQVFEYTSIGRVLFGINAQQQVGVEAQKLTEERNCLIITDPGVAKAHLIDGIEVSLKKAGFTVSICDEAVPEPTIPDYKKVLEIAKGEKVGLIGKRFRKLGNIQLDKYHIKLFMCDQWIGKPKPSCNDIIGTGWFSLTEMYSIGLRLAPFVGDSLMSVAYLIQHYSHFPNQWI